MKKFITSISFFICISSFASQNFALHDFNTSNQLGTFFSNNDGVSDATQILTGGIGGSGSVEVAPWSNGAVFVSKQGYANGGDGTVYLLKAYLKSVGNSGYGGLGFTSVQNATFSQYAAPASGLGISVHGGGYEYNNNTSYIPGDWMNSNITPSAIFNLLNNGSPDQWYLLSLKLTDLSGDNFELEASVWSVNADGTLVRTTPDAVDKRNFTNTAMAAAPIIYSYFAFEGDRVRSLDSYSISLTGSTLIELGAPSVIASAEINSQDRNQINLSANMLSIGLSSIIERGFVYSNSPNPTISQNKLLVACNQHPCTGPFQSKLTGLPSNIYYLRAFATNSSGTSYSTESTITINNDSTIDKKNNQFLPSPLQKKDVIGSIEAWTTGANTVAHVALDRVQNRLDLLSRQPKGKVERSSSQGIDIRFSDPRMQRLLFDLPQTQVQKPEQILIKAVNLVAQPQATNDRLVKEAEVAMLNQIAIAREEALGKINPTFDSNTKVGDWSWWTMGTIMLGKHGERFSSSGIKVHADYLTFGLDRINDSIGVVGASFMLAQNDYDVGNVGSKVFNDSNSFSLYNAYSLSEVLSIRSIVGGSNFDLKTQRIDGSEYLMGKRSAQQGFLSIELRHNGHHFDSFHPLDIEWYMKADFVNTKFKQFSEEGGTLALLFEEQKVKNRRIGLGLDLKTKLQLGRRQVIPYLGLEYATNISPLTNADMRYVSEAIIYRHTIQKPFNADWKVDFGFDLGIGPLLLGVSYERTHQRKYGYLDMFNLKLNGRF